MFTSAEAQFLVAVQRRKVSVLDRPHDLRLSFHRLQVRGDELEQEQQAKRPVDEQVAVSFDGVTVLAVEVDGVCVEGEGGEAEEESASWGKSVEKVRLAERWNLINGCTHTISEPSNLSDT